MSRTRTLIRRCAQKKRRRVAPLLPEEMGKACWSLLRAGEKQTAAPCGATVWEPLFLTKHCSDSPVAGCVPTTRVRGVSRAGVCDVAHGALLQGLEHQRSLLRTWRAPAKAPWEETLRGKAVCRHS
jgi:hypothetical protein